MKRFLVFSEKKFRVARSWSNKELKKFSSRFEGDIINVSAWKDEDKEGDFYKNYFPNAKSYSLSNYKHEARGFQGKDGEIFLDLTKELPSELQEKYDVVFNHTTLEHIFEIDIAFKNLCLMSKDLVIIVVPFLQEMHADYGDYWRFTPLALKKLFEKNGLEMAYVSYNEDPGSSVYIYAMASKVKGKWDFKKPFSYKAKRNILCSFEGFVACRSIQNSFIYRLCCWIFKKIKE